MKAAMPATATTATARQAVRFISFSFELKANSEDDDGGGAQTRSAATCFRLRRVAVGTMLASRR